MQFGSGVLRGLFILLILNTFSTSVLAQVKNYAPNLPSARQHAVPAQVQIKKHTPSLVIPQAEELLNLIRTTIIALNQANQTGNYTVLRDLSAPDFRNANDASRLGLIFQALRDRAVDLSPLLNISPEVSEVPAINAQGLLRLAGFFPTHPLRVNFDLSFQYLDNLWRPYTIGVYLAQIEAELQTPALPQKAAARSK